jgi:GT2 family glycosyltransferase
MSSIAVLITCHNRKEKTIKCLHALFNQIGLDLEFKVEVFLVDDGCTDGTSDSIRLLFPKVRIIKGDGNLYWNRGMHLAWSMAASAKEFDYYLWLNDDTNLYDIALLSMLKSAVITKNISAICGSTYSQGSQMVSYGGNSKSGKILAPNGQLQEVFSFNGNVVLIPKYIFSKIGNLDKKFPHAIGDFDYSLRIRKEKLKSFITENFIGTCERDIKIPRYYSPEFSLNKRLNYLYSPNAYCHPYYYFIFELRHYGIITSIKHFLTIHLRLLFPKIWLIK